MRRLNVSVYIGLEVCLNRMDSIIDLIEFRDHRSHEKPLKIKLIAIVRQLFELKSNWYRFGLLLNKLEGSVHPYS